MAELKNYINPIQPQINLTNLTDLELLNDSPFIHGSSDDSSFFINNINKYTLGIIIVILIILLLYIIYKIYDNQCYLNKLRSNNNIPIRTIGVNNNQL